MKFLDDKSAALIRSELRRINSKLCCLLERDYDFSEIPEFENNTAALAGGLEPGKPYRLPMEDDVVKIALVVSAE